MSHFFDFASCHVTVEGEGTGVPVDNYKCVRTMSETPAVQTPSSSITDTPVVPKSSSPVLSSLQLQSPAPNSLLGIPTCLFNTLSHGDG